MEKAAVSAPAAGVGEEGGRHDRVRKPVPVQYDTTSDPVSGFDPFPCMRYQPTRWAASQRFCSICACAAAFAIEIAISGFRKLTMVMDRLGSNFGHPFQLPNSRRTFICATAD